jgi:hypothetical protein
MTLSEAAEHASRLAASLEAAVPLATTRIEHVRVSSHAYQARSLANTLLEASRTLPEGQTAHYLGSRPFEVTHGP